MTKAFEISDIASRYGNIVTASDINEYSTIIGISSQTIISRLKDYKTGHGVWKLNIPEQEEKIYKSQSEKITSMDNISFIPEKDSNFISFGNFTDIKKVISSGKFYPVFITGLSGNGKTFAVEQACAQLKREMIRVNITIETDEDDLLGGFRLINGETSWHDGPVIQALTRGAILLLDEIDLASNKIMCLQSVLEGNGVFLKKIGKYIKPVNGFNIIATANTKGKGSEDGRFIGTNILNEAFLERFPITLEQSYPNAKTEISILNKVLESNGLTDIEFCTMLVSWSDIIRKTFFDGGVDELISTRRLVHIVKALSIFGNNRKKAIEVCINRFDNDTKKSFLELYSKIDDKIDKSIEISEVEN